MSTTTITGIIIMALLRHVMHRCWLKATILKMWMIPHWLAMPARGMVIWSKEIISSQIQVIRKPTVPYQASDTTKSVDLQAVVESGAVHLTWTLNNITPMGVEVYRDTDSDARGRGRIAWMRDGNALIDEDATPGTTYDYWIKATEADWTVTNSMAVPAAVGSYSD
jgi:hypothetical protein